MVPNFAGCSFCPSWNLVGERLPQTLLLFCFRRRGQLRCYQKITKGVFAYAQNLQHTKRSHIVKTRLDDEEYSDFLRRLELYGINQSEFIRQAVSGATIRPVITVSPVNDELLSALGKLTAEYGKIGSNLNQIARSLNEYHTPYPQLAAELRNTATDLAALKFEILQKVGDALGNIQTYQL